MGTLVYLTAPCAGCGRSVTVVRRPVLITGHVFGCRCTRTAHGCRSAESRELREVVVLDAGMDTGHDCTAETKAA